MQPLSYKILAAEVMATEKDDKMAAEKTFALAGLDAELFRTGKTKVSRCQVIYSK